MSEAEWEDSNDAGAMLDFIWSRQGVVPSEIDLPFGGDTVEPGTAAGNAKDLVGSLHRYYLASCRSVWRLLPQEASRHGVELAERFLVGGATAEEVSAANWDTEGAAFRIENNSVPQKIARWVEGVRAIPDAELRSMLHVPGAADEVEPRELLERAAYFADFAMLYPCLTPQGPPPDNYRLFLSATVLRRHLAYPTEPPAPRPSSA